MKNKINILGIFLVMIAFTTSCSKDNDPTDDNLFVGTYKGNVAYTDGETNIATDDGRVTLVKVGDSYNFDFSNSIPSLNGIKMEKNQNLLISSDGTIKIDEGNLTIAYSKDGKLWGADCTR
jgi:hypothetical protein